MCLRLSLCSVCVSVLYVLTIFFKNVFLVINSSQCFSHKIKIGDIFKKHFLF